MVALLACKALRIGPEVTKACVRVAQSTWNGLICFGD